MGDPSQRMLTLLSLLQTGQQWTGPELAARMDVPPRTLRRDLDRLRRLGYPIVARTGPGGHYRLEAGAAMPPLLLTDDEAVAVAVSLRTAAAVAPTNGGLTHAPDDEAPIDDAAGRALRKLQRILPVRLRATVAAVRDVTEAVPPAASATIPVEVFGVVGRAARSQRRILFSYRDRDGAPTTREIEPYRQVLNRGRWYLLGWDVQRQDWRTFRLDRVADVTLTPHHFTPRELPADTGAAYVEMSWREARYRAVITFGAPVEVIGARLGARDGLLEPLEDGRCRYTAWVDSFEWLTAVVIIAGVDFVVDEPPEFIEYCRGLRARLSGAIPESDPG
ncbi:helix-turn-helix transcriptional regulator [Phytoactinopolyspora limicola]|uniref:helix-turn-helix transcriptional regulator n=1 Tax=Phytoactinopolyspora limicola TaxID=2715536 RepID=UPI001A9C43E7|nr:YafY family protein [Phytoactinopolyspora limicola]